MSADASDPLEAEGVLNPATAWGSDGDLYLYPRMVAEGNSSRIGKARVTLVDGVPTSVERQGVVLEPDRPWEHGVRHGGVEDPRITWVPSLDAHVMTYVAFGPFGSSTCRCDLSRSERLAEARAGPVRLRRHPRDRPQSLPEQGRRLLPRSRPRSGRPAKLCRPPPADVGVLLTETAEVAGLPAGTTDPRASIWISYIPADDVKADVSALTRPSGHRFVAGSEFDWEILKIGADRRRSESTRAGS